MSSNRQEGRRRAARIISVAASTVSSYAGVGRSLGVSPARVGQWADPDDSAASMTLGDILAARGDFADAVLTAALADVRARTKR